METLIGLGVVAAVIFVGFLILGYTVTAFLYSEAQPEWRSMEMGKILLAAMAMAGWFLLFSDIMAWLAQPDENVTTIMKTPANNVTTVAKTPANNVQLCEDPVGCSVTIYSLAQEEEDDYRDEPVCIDGDGGVTDCPPAVE